MNLDNWSGDCEASFPPSLAPVSTNGVLLVAELIYKEVLDWEERTKNGVIRGQSASIGEWRFFKFESPTCAHYAAPFLLNPNPTL